MNDDMSMEHQRELADKLVSYLPSNEEDLALKLGVPRNLVASVCRALHKQRRIKKDTRWDVPAHWKL